MVSVISNPKWIQVLISEKFFKSCLVHESEKKNEKNTFCLDCCTSLCPHCLPPHPNHHLLQVRRYVYQDVIRLNDAQNLIDCSFVQPYITNSAKVVFLQQRPMTRQFKGSGNLCIICNRNLQHPYLFCSLSCKVHHMGRIRIGPREQYLFHCELDGPRLENLQMTPESVLEGPISIGNSSGSSSNSVSVLGCRTLFKRKCSREMEFAVAVNRRKGVPHRSPFH